MRSLSALTICGIILGIALVVPRASIAESPDLLTAIQDESTLEKQIAKALEKTSGTKPTIRFADDDMTDMVLAYIFQPGGIGKLTVTIDTMGSARNKDGQMTERAITIRAFHVLPATAKTEIMSRKLMDFNQSFMRANWAPDRVYLDSDGDIRFDSTLNIPGESIPMECFHDKLSRMLSAWKDYWKEATEKFPSIENDGLPAGK